MSKDKNNAWKVTISDGECTQQGRHRYSKIISILLGVFALCILGVFAYRIITYDDRSMLEKYLENGSYDKAYKYYQESSDKDEEENMKIITDYILSLQLKYENNMTEKNLAKLWDVIIKFSYEIKNDNPHLYHDLQYIAKEKVTVRVGYTDKSKELMNEYIEEYSEDVISRSSTYLEIYESVISHDDIELERYECEFEKIRIDKKNIKSALKNKEIDVLITDSPEYNSENENPGAYLFWKYCVDLQKTGVVKYEKSTVED